MSYSSLISIENVFQAWEEFRKGKRAKRDVRVFERHLEDNLFDLYQKLATKNYRHSSYVDFYVCDPKRRHIHKATVADRVIHHLLYNYLYRVFDKTFIFDSYSCRKEKGIHKAVARLARLAKIVSKNYGQNCWAQKLDIKKFFDSVDHQILIDLISKRVKDKDIVWFISQIIKSFHSEQGKDKGIPLGNLTSQIFANICLAELDQFVKHKLKVKYYLRYADDFLILASKKDQLIEHRESIESFLESYLKLQFHPQKIILRKLTWGIDFCGYIVLPYHLLPRTKTRRRIFKKVLRLQLSDQSLQSYLGYFTHANTHQIQQNLKNLFWLNQQKLSPFQ